MFLINEKGKVKKLKQKRPEARIGDLLLKNPELLGHVNEVRTRNIVWFWNRPNGPGDLFGFDEHGRIVIVELKKKLGFAEERKAVSQLRAASRYARRLTLGEVDKHYKRDFAMVFSAAGIRPARGFARPKGRANVG
jgi:RecB family endonuclease NucS